MADRGVSCSHCVARRLPEPEWFRTLKPGDMIKLGGSYRRVLRVSFRLCGALHSLTFRKLVRSRHANPTTTYTASDIKRLKVRRALAGAERPS